MAIRGSAVCMLGSELSCVACEQMHKPVPDENAWMKIVPCTTLPQKFRILDFAPGGVHPHHEFECHTVQVVAYVRVHMIARWREQVCSCS